ncbi:MAG: thiamine pyrophosphate-dependent enzyme [Chitinophagales bacterium]|nr:thiamine pyrophosphate-dependent enzyme [Chitinophagales bacterium]
MNLKTEHTVDNFVAEVLNDYKIACISREASLLGRREVLTGKAKFGIFGDGKEIPQIAMSKAFQNGDWRSGYYRDQTFMLAAGLVSVQQLFSQLYADTNIVNEPNSGGRQMNAHFATRLINDDGSWKPFTQQKNTAADASPTAGQMPRALGLALASKLFRDNTALHSNTALSINGNEVCFATIGDASTSEGHFWETLNAATVMRVPLVVNVWDDGYGISVPKKYQTTKASISEALAGFEINEVGDGILIYKVKGWDYPALIEAYQDGVARARNEHRPVLFHIEEVTQPQGHSTSGSHERYKTKERLQWESEFDGIVKMKEWMLSNALASEEALNQIEEEAKKEVLDAKQAAWNNYAQPIKTEMIELLNVYAAFEQHSVLGYFIQQETNSLKAIREPFRKDILSSARKVMRMVNANGVANEFVMLSQFIDNYKKSSSKLYTTHLHSETPLNALMVPEQKAVFAEDAQSLNGFEILNQYFDQLFSNNPLVVAFGEDVGYIGDVNQGFAGLQAKHGVERIFDTGIREATIMGQAIGLSLRGLRPIAEIQYLDYLLYGLQPLSDDVATLQYRTAGGQRAPLIIRTRGHRLEGIWHTGSPMQMMLGTLRGMYVCTPRNMTQAAGMYNTLLKSDEPGIVVECLNGYRLKEKLPNNLSEFTVPLGKIEVVNEGSDITVVTYGSSVRIALEAAEQLAQFGVSVEVIDVQTLLPFDLNHDILKSLQKTNRVLFFDEDVPGGATAYMMQEVIEKQEGFFYLDAPAQCLSAAAHRSAYGTDGDYFCKPSVDDLIEKVQEMMSF